MSLTRQRKIHTKKVVKESCTNATVKGASTQLQTGRRRSIFCDVKEVHVAKGEEVGSPSIPKTLLLLQQCIDLCISAKHTDQVRDIPTILFNHLKVWMFSSLAYFFLHLSFTFSGFQSRSGLVLLFSIFLLLLF